jgi:hypothetical protein
MWDLQSPAEDAGFCVDFYLNFVVNIRVILICACDALVRMKCIQIHKIEVKKEIRVAVL